MYALVDCNNFYASCERVFRPHLRNKPIVVLSNNDGCVIARSNEAKKYGIKMGVPVYQCQEIIEKNNIEVCSANFPLYGDMSNRVMNILHSATEHVEIYSIDEAFLLVDGIADPHLFSRDLREKILRWTGIPVSIGIAETKTRAKLANEIAKTHPEFAGIYTLPPDCDDTILKDIPVGEVWGIGRALTPFLISNGVKTAWDFQHLPDPWIKKNMTITGLHTAWELRGIPCVSFEEVHEMKKSIVCSRSFGKRVTKEDDLAEAVSLFATRVAEKLRQEKAVCAALQVFVRTGVHSRDAYYANSTLVRMNSPTNYTPDLIGYSKVALHQIFKEGYRYYKIGVTAIDIRSQDTVQLSLYHPEITPEKKKLMRALDSINVRYGTGSIEYASSGVARGWQGKREHCSPRYTTTWEELLTISV